MQVRVITASTDSLWFSLTHVWLGISRHKIELGCLKDIEAIESVKRFATKVRTKAWRGRLAQYVESDNPGGKVDHPKALLFVQGLKWPGFLPQLLHHPQAQHLS